MPNSSTKLGENLKIQAGCSSPPANAIKSRPIRYHHPFLALPGRRLLLSFLFFSFFFWRVFVSSSPSHYTGDSESSCAPEWLLCTGMKGAVPVVPWGQGPFRVEEGQKAARWRQCSGNAPSAQHCNASFCLGRSVLGHDAKNPIHHSI